MFAICLLDITHGLYNTSPGLSTFQQKKSCSRSVLDEWPVCASRRFAAIQDYYSCQTGNCSLHRGCGHSSRWGLRSDWDSRAALSQTVNCNTELHITGDQKLLRQINKHHKQDTISSIWLHLYAWYPESTIFH